MKRSVLAIMLASLVLSAGLGFAVLSISRPAHVDAHAMTAANELVAAGHYAEAVQMYEQLIAQGTQNAALYYNLGNAAFFLGDVGRAVAAYEQAAALTPRDPDIRANLALARQQARGQVNLALAQPGARGPVTRPSASPLGSLAGVTSRWLTLDELALLALGAWFALGFLVFAYHGLQPERRPAPLRAAVAVALLVVLVTGGVLATRTATPPLAAPATFMDLPAARSGGQHAAVPTNISSPLRAWRQFRV